ncbi:hypothetical protein T492DRAFT_160308 [Pavlovales sp. CCMP2436]|nr:hypothetical protein T492DRAFT_160308 [Pavlovales sp. CCMP2436]
MVPTMPADEFTGNSSAPPLLSFSLPFARPVALFNHSRPMAPMELLQTAAGGVDLSVHVEINSPVPTRLLLKQPKIDVFLKSADWAARARAERARARAAGAGWARAWGRGVEEEEEEASHVATAVVSSAEGEGGELVLRPGMNRFVLRARLLSYLGEGCAAPHCFEPTAKQPLECVPCAASHFIYLAAFQQPMPLDVRLSLQRPAGWAAGVPAGHFGALADAPARTHRGSVASNVSVALARLLLFSLPHAGSDTPANLRLRTTGFFAAQAQAAVLAPVFDQMIHVAFDIWATIEKTTTAGAKPFVQLELGVTNPLSFALRVGMVKAGGWLVDSNGVPSGHDLPLQHLLGDGYAPALNYPLVAHMSKLVNETVPINGTTSGQKLSALVTWEAIARVVDEAYVRARLCLKIGNGLIAVELQQGAQPLQLAVPFEVSEASVLLRRACHQPAGCAANASEASAGLQPLPKWRLLGAAAKASPPARSAGAGGAGEGEAVRLASGKGSAGSAFATEPLDASAGLRVRFRFELKQKSCHVACGSFSGGLALVLASEPPDALPAQGKQCTATLTPESANLPSVSPLQVHTFVSCAGYRGLGGSVGAVLSVDQSRLITLDSARGAAAVFSDGNVTDGGSGTGSSHAYAQLEHARGSSLLGEAHDALLVWQAQSKELYLFLDGSETPALFASLSDPAPLWRPERTFVGFTAESAYELELTVWDVRAHTPAADASESALVYEPLQLLTACAEHNEVVLDPRDSCGFPLLSTTAGRAGGDNGWRIRVDRADGEDPGAGHVLSVDAQDDGTYVVKFRVDEAGNYTVRGKPALLPYALAGGAADEFGAEDEGLAVLGAVEVRPCTRPSGSDQFGGGQGAGS